MENYIVRFQKLCQIRTRGVVLVMGMIASLVLVFQNFTLPSRNFQTHVLTKTSLPDESLFPSSVHLGKFSLLTDVPYSKHSSIASQNIDSSKVFGTRGGIKHEVEGNVMDGSIQHDEILDDDIDLGVNGDPKGEVSLDVGDGLILKKVRDPVDGFITLPDGSQNKVQEQGNDLAPVSNDLVTSLVHEENKSINGSVSSLSLLSEKEKKESSLREQVAKSLTKKESVTSLSIRLSTRSNTSVASSIPILRKKKVTKKRKKVNSPISISTDRTSYHAMRPRWSSVRDQQLLAVKAQIENAPIVKNDRQLYVPAFWNFSIFKRSYELMEQTLKVYVYKEGQKPIFHQPLLRGIYASEGWFMKLMEGNRQFVVRDPRKAHLFYLPFSSRLLQFTLYVPNSHSHRNLEQALKDYVHIIAAKHPFWNRTGGADHFLAACHDWAPLETRHTMGRAIRALCNTDLRDGFTLGKDVSLPETYVRSALNPQRDLGGNPADQRPTLAFFSGNMHGSLRPILLRHWENKDPDMKICGPIPGGVKGKIAYIQHMKSSKYCICPRGYEVNSPRVVEAIFYECVPVIISDNYVLPFFEILNWEAFSVTVREADVPRLKDILLLISETKYRELQMAVRRVQQHFLWHSKPVKYDLFHMILHNIWFNRVYQVRTSKSAIQAVGEKEAALLKENKTKGP